MNFKNQDVEALFKAFASLKSQDEVKKFLIDLCTPSEILAMSGRWKAAQMLNQGLPYREIYELSGVSTATVTRIARCLSFGTGGYQIALDNTPSKKTITKKTTKDKNERL